MINLKKSDDQKRNYCNTWDNKWKKNLLKMKRQKKKK